ncbi:MAG: General transcription factor IIH subunit 2 [Marteilia pararefringens]
MVSHSEDGIGSSGVKKQNFVWEKSLEKNWELLNIDKDGKLIAESEKEYQAILDRLNKTTPNVKLGLARYIFIAIDTSESSRMTHDLKPNNLLCTVNLLKSFIKKLLQKNPIVQVVFAVSFGRKAILLDSSGQSSSLLGTLSGQLQSVTNRFSTKKGDTDTSGGNFSDLPSTQHVLQLAESFFR